MGMFDMFKGKGKDNNFAVDMVVNMLGGTDGIKKKVLNSIFPSLEKWLISHMESVELRSYEAQSVIIIFKNAKTEKLDYTLATISKDDEIERIIESENLESKLTKFLDSVQIPK